MDKILLSIQYISKAQQGADNSQPIYSAQLVV